MTCPTMIIACTAAVLAVGACSTAMDKQAARQGQAGYANDRAGGGNTGAPGTSPPAMGGQ
jgi:hypothetical protein